MLPRKMLGFLWFMFLLCDADSTCPTNLNPLTLDPPEIIEEYEKSIFVNCSSRDEIHEGMYWSYGNKTSEKEEDESFISWTESRPDWNVDAQCVIMLNATLKCSKDVKITIYKNPENVFLYPINHKMAAEEETPYELQCDILNVAPVQNLTVRWYKDNQTIMTDSFTNTSKTQISESSVLKVNLSRGDNGAQFRCEAQLDFGPHGPQCPVISSDIQTVTVHYAPEFKNKTDIDDIYVGEGDNVTLTCEAEGNPPPVFHWTNDEGSISEYTNDLYINQVNTGSTYSCTAANDLGNITKQIHIHVVKTTMTKATPAASAPIADCPLTLTPAEIVVRFGDSVSVNCSTSATDSSGMGWEATLGGRGLDNVLAMTWSVNKLEDWAMEPQCYITLQNNHQCNVTPVITLYKPPDIVSVPDYGPMMEGTELQLTCDIINVAPVKNLKVKWYRDNETVHTQMFHGSSVTPVNVSSTLRVTYERDYNGAHFRCEAELHLGPKGPEVVPTASSVPRIAVVHYKPLIQNCSRSYTGVEHKFNMKMVQCQADGNPPPTVKWYRQGKLIDENKRLNKTDSGEYKVVAENRFGNSSASVDITIEYIPSFTCNDRYDVEENGKLQTTCEPEGIPTPQITWFKDGNEIVPPQRWTKHDSGKYLLRATNKYGGVNHTLYLNVLYAPVFKEGDYQKEVSLGENVTFDCSVEGNPTPEIRWKFKSEVDSSETTWWRQNNISITVATSTNAGVYICIATNKVGTVTRSVTLKMKDETSAFPFWLLILLVIIATILILFLIMIIAHKCSRQHGHYTFIPDKTNDGLDIPMATKSAGTQA